MSPGVAPSLANPHHKAADVSGSTWRLLRAVVQLGQTGCNMLSIELILGIALSRCTLPSELLLHSYVSISVPF